ncbi:uncharacterized protein LOC133823806 [Humulus lupulus]|uniref:uncharacterized protein LOC133823806 n=1 Tax=Humulus lupulus TaxID=3486 RepID=UPI002B40EA49|nr:uncharacterized protein LOC133823806 [Humulus lupulus]
MEKKFHVTRASRVQFQVTQENKGDFVLDLPNKNFTCRWFQLNGIPCAHAVASIWKMGLNMLDCVDAYYKHDAFIKAYESVVEPMPSPYKWLLSNKPILPPPQYKNPGRPKKFKK